MDNTQPQLPFTGKELAETGMNLALQNAETKKPGWQKNAFRLLIDFIGTRKKFMCEDFRAFCAENGLSIPPSNRAFGGIILKAAKAGMIKRVGYGQVKNPKAHSANAAVWETITITN